MRYWVGFDVGKAFHWVCVLDEEGEVILSRRVEAEEQDIESCHEEIKSLGGDRMVATDLLGCFTCRELPSTVPETATAGSTRATVPTPT